MQAMRTVRSDELVCDVEAGLNGERFERELARRGYTFGHFPSSIYCSTVGGPQLATRAASRLSTKYGKVEDRVAGLTRKLAMNAALGRSELVNKLFGAVEKVARRGCRLIIGLEGARIRTEVEAALTFAEPEAAGARDKGEEPGWAWLKHRYAVSYKMSPVFRDGAFVDMELAALKSTARSVRARRSASMPS